MFSTQQLTWLFRCFIAVVVVPSLLLSSIHSQQQATLEKSATEKSVTAKSDAEVGRDLLLNYSFLPRDFHQSTFDELWKDWPEPLRAEAENATPNQRREMAFARFGMSGRVDDSSKPLQYVVDDAGYWSMNCFACHGGKVEGKTIEGLPNAQLALETLYADMRRTKMRLKKPLTQMDIGSIAVPMGTTVGTSNAVVFGIALMNYRDKDLNLKPLRLPPKLTHHDMDAPAWWNVKYRERLYIDGFVKRGHRALIPFVMDQRNSGPKMIGWEGEFKKVYAYIISLESPKYEGEIDKTLAEQGRAVFDDHCASCHGSYGDEPTYPSRIVPLAEIGTDPVRLSALSIEHRKGYHASWYANFGKDATEFNPDGYQAPPLHGVWASAPYFHNGSVPTLWHVLNPKQRPSIWRRPDNDAYDHAKMGLAVENLTELPKDLRRDVRREYFDTSVNGKSAAGHDYPDRLTDEQKEQLLEYLKTL